MLIHDVCAAEKAFVSLPSPLTAYDDISFSNGASSQAIKLTAGLHSQTWVSGIPILVDVHISNTCKKTIKRVELQLEKATFYFDHAAAFTTTEAANHLRYPDRTEKEIVPKVVTKKARHGWKGVPPQSYELRTRDIDVPSGLVTIDAGAWLVELSKSSATWIEAAAVGHCRRLTACKIYRRTFVLVMACCYRTDKSAGRFFGVQCFLNVLISWPFTPVVQTALDIKAY